MSLESYAKDKAGLEEALRGMRQQVHDKQTSRHLPIYKETQHNSTTPEEDFFEKKSAAQVGLESTIFCSLDRVLYQLSYCDSIAGWDESYNVKARQGKASQSNST